jgi:hypothetical protein
MGDDGSSVFVHVVGLAYGSRVKCGVQEEKAVGYQS